MINQGNNVPDKTIAVFLNPFETSLDFDDKERIFKIIEKPPKKREWFMPHFYKCLPLVIGNQYGFIIKNEFDFGFIWNGSNDPENSIIFMHNKVEEVNKKYPRIESHFGHGIITINPPFTLRTPPGVNLMTVNPPNFIIPNITAMTGVVETDNLRRNFTFNLKIQMPNIETIVPAGSALAAFIPIPRNYADSFKLEIAENIFSEKLISEEIQAMVDADTYRNQVERKTPEGVGRDYFKGQDVYKNKFLDHQKP